MADLKNNPNQENRNNFAQGDESLNKKTNMRADESEQDTPEAIQEQGNIQSRNNNPGSKPSGSDLNIGGSGSDMNKGGNQGNQGSRSGGSSSGNTGNTPGKTGTNTGNTNTGNLGNERKK